MSHKTPRRPLSLELTSHATYSGRRRRWSSTIITLLNRCDLSFLDSCPAASRSRCWVSPYSARRLSTWQPSCFVYYPSCLSLHSFTHPVPGAQHSQVASLNHRNLGPRPPWQYKIQRIWPTNMTSSTVPSKAVQEYAKRACCSPVMKSLMRWERTWFTSDL